MSALLGKLLSSVDQEAAFNARSESSLPGKSESCFPCTCVLEFLKRKQADLPHCQQLRGGGALKELMCHQSVLLFRGRKSGRTAT
jgi:hypothetical protein